MKKHKPKKRTDKKHIRGPKPDLLKIEGDWRDAIEKSLRKNKPQTGWPK
jgi:hypothetical protein